MSLAVVLSRGVAGLDAPLVTVECHADSGLPKFGLLEMTETEVGGRVRAALRNCNSNFDFPPRKDYGRLGERTTVSTRSRWRQFDSHPKG
jgi:magnesium chelatase family protein